MRCNHNRQSCHTNGKWIADCSPLLVASKVTDIIVVLATEVVDHIVGTILLGVIMTLVQQLDYLAHGVAVHRLRSLQVMVRQ